MGDRSTKPNEPKTNLTSAPSTPTIEYTKTARNTPSERAICADWMVGGDRAQKWR